MGEETASAGWVFLTGAVFQAEGRISRGADPAGEDAREIPFDFAQGRLSVG
jgi:hypothetical protein